MSIGKPMAIELTPKTACCAPRVASRLSPEEAQQTSDDLQILGHPVRLQILAMLAAHSEPVCVCDLEAGLPIKQPTVSHHLRLLREAGLVDCERRGPWAYYFLQHQNLAALRARVASTLEILG